MRENHRAIARFMIWRLRNCVIEKLVHATAFLNYTISHLPNFQSNHQSLNSSQAHQLHRGHLLNSSKLIDNRLSRLLVNLDHSDRLQWTQLDSSLRSGADPLFSSPSEREIGDVDLVPAQNSPHSAYHAGNVAIAHYDQPLFKG